MVNPQALPHKPAVSGPKQQAWIRALDRARLVATRKPTYECGHDRFRVYSARAAAEYTVCPVEDDGQINYHCECAAGMSGQVCWHAALVAALPQEVVRRQKHRASRRAERTYTVQDIAALQADCDRANARAAALFA